LRNPAVLISERFAVELACRPARNQIGVFVEFAAAPKFVVGVKLKSEALFTERKFDADVVEKPKPTELQKLDDVVLNARPVVAQ
jgi:hypothetical protein